MKMASQKWMKNNSAKIYVGTTGFKKIKKKVRYNSILFMQLYVLHQSNINKPRWHSYE